MMNHSDSDLFSKFRLSDVLRHQVDLARKQVDSVPKEQFLANTEEQVTEHIYYQLEIAPLEVLNDHITRSDLREIRILRENRDGEEIDFPGVEITLTIPYRGETDLWGVQPSRTAFSPPRGTIEKERGNDRQGIVRIYYQFLDRDYKTETLNQEFERALSSIRQYVDSIKVDIDAHNPRLKTYIRDCVKKRRERLAQIAEVSKSIEIPIERRSGAPDISVLPVQRRFVEPLSSGPPTEPEYGISEDNYNLILDVIRHEGATYERTPVTFRVLDEEDLRNILLAHLNGYFKGQATGEAFRKKGKTDIHIEFENRSAFVGECKLWKGDQKVHETIDQLLGYVTWRDVKTALIFFNKTVGRFQSTQEKMEGILQSHPYFLSINSLLGKTEWQVVLRSAEDPDRRVQVRVFLFNLHTVEKPN